MKSNVTTSQNYWLNERIFSSPPGGPFPIPPFPFPPVPPIPVPNPIPELPLPPFPFPNRCFRLGPVSGRYDGSSNTDALDLRIDIDQINANSPILNLVSGDNYAVFSFQLPGRPRIHFRTYKESWVVEEPEITWKFCSVEITGTLKFWKAPERNNESIKITVSWKNFALPKVATVQFFKRGRLERTLSCDRKGSTLREVLLEVDICDSVNAAPILPFYNTHSHNTRPTLISNRDLTLEDTFREAGINLSLDSTNTIIDDSTATFNTWSVAELHDAMEDHFSSLSTNQRWNMWGLLAGEFDNSGVVGIMFDAFGAPERQGFAIFKDHWIFDDLVANPNTQAEHAAMRDFLYTWIHEAGHAFNFQHSWSKSRPSALSWMNYPSEYDNINGANSFWEKFSFQFDEEELAHLRHGNKAAVIMGGDGFGTGGHVEEHADAAYFEPDGPMPIQLDIRGKQVFEFMEPVSVELRLKNLLDLEMDIDQRLNPEFGNVQLFIQRPNGQMSTYHPAVKQLALVDKKTLAANTNGQSGKDRVSKEIPIYYGKDRFYFDTPGTYKVRAVYNFFGLPIPSNVMTIKIKYPNSAKEATLAQDYFSKEVGLSLYMNGSKSEHLAKGMACIQKVQQMAAKDSALAAKLAMPLSNALAQPFHKIALIKNKKQVKQVYKGNPKEALDLLTTPVAYCIKNKQMHNNLFFEKAIHSKVDCFLDMNDKKEAKEELQLLNKHLSGRNVNQNVLSEIDKKIQAL